MSEVNKCNGCGKFKPWEELKGLAGDSDEIGNFDQWFECVDCMCGSDLREFAQQKIKEITSLQAELKQKEAQLSEFTEGITIEKADKKETYYFETGGAWFQTKYIDGRWIAWDLYKNSNQSITAKRLYRLPLPTAVKEDT